MTLNAGAVAEAEADLLSRLEDGESRGPEALIGRLALPIHRAEPGSSPCETMDHLP